MKITDRIRRLIETSDQSRYAISKATGIDQATLSRFVKGERGLSMEALDKLAEFFGWQLQKKGK